MEKKSCSLARYNNSLRKHSRKLKKIDLIKEEEEEEESSSLSDNDKTHRKNIKSRSRTPLANRRRFCIKEKIKYVEQYFEIKKISK